MFSIDSMTFILIILASLTTIVFIRSSEVRDTLKEDYNYVKNALVSLFKRFSRGS